MDFYNQQDTKRWQSAVLLLAFVIVLLALGALIHFLITALSLALGQGGSFAQPSKPALFMIGMVWLMMIAGSMFRLMDLKAGGAVLARRFGAVHASDRLRYTKEKQLLNVVAEMSIASSTELPDVFVLRGENSINAFVLGNSKTRPVIVVTEGALEILDREQIQAVVAHEFGHIVNGDLPLNMRLLVAMGGLMAVDEVGRLLISRWGVKLIHPGMIIGYLVCTLGKVGVVSGRLICASFSRQREYLADATAVQLSRNPFALASALDVIDEYNYRPALEGIYTREVLHLCFQSGKARRWLGKLMATHPDITHRIAVIEPHYEVKKRKEDKSVDDVSKAQLPAAVASPSNVIPLGLVPADNIEFVNSDSGVVFGGGSEATVAATVLSDRIVLMLSDTTRCTAALFALFVHENVDEQNDYYNALTLSFNDEFTEKVKNVVQQMPDELSKDQLGIVLHVSGLLNARMSDEQRQMITYKLEQLLAANGSYHLMDYARVQLIRRKLNVEFPVVSAVADKNQSAAQASKAKSFESMGSEFALLLSLMVESSGASADDLDEQFQRVLKCYTMESFPRRTTKESGIIDELEAAFQTLYMQPKSIRHAFVQHCIEIMQHDGFIMPSERALLDLFAASLGCEELIAA